MIGPLSRFEGRRFASGWDALPPGSLFHCPGCDLRFRHPYPSQEILTQIYEDLPAGLWRASGPLHYWPWVLEKMRELNVTPRSVLDVGAHEGDFLSWLPADWEKHAIEPGAPARKTLETRNIPLFAQSIENIRPTRRFGVITMFDVLEHLQDPLSGLKQMLPLLSDTGALFILTGASDTLPWHVFKNHYWYCTLPEHLSFMSLPWFSWAARQTGLRVRDYRYTAYGPTSVGERVKQWVKASVYVSSRRFAGLRNCYNHIPRIKNVVKMESVPWMMGATDHLLLVLTR